MPLPQPLHAQIVQGSDDFAQGFAEGFSYALKCAQNLVTWIPGQDGEQADKSVKAYEAATRESLAARKGQSITIPESQTDDRQRQTQAPRQEDQQTPQFEPHPLTWLAGGEG